MKYMLLVCRDEPVWEALTTAERREVYEGMVRLSEELRARGQYVSGAPLVPSSEATSVRVRDGRRLVTSGPFAETREQLGGYMIVDVQSVEEAVEIAARVPLARSGAVEIRAVRDGAPP